jgi:hypothetical protein
MYLGEQLQVPKVRCRSLSPNARNVALRYSVPYLSSSVSAITDATKPNTIYFKPTENFISMTAGEEEKRL